ncbi:amino acid permease [Exiguobacterium oxidotolerans]|uniref:Putative aminoacid permease n=1 Tax=Exiguobacterium oxidotolerans TaxID=223958 RepID=A0A653I813_9BACL|nr:amino acid permease [Exiguobacterium oxidotolerans]VWX35247.1 putative aminoacid permease [Exiguobacterium oxidotolerans]
MEQKTTFRRKMESRHIVMLSLGGVIGTGLFLSTGYTLEQAGRIGTILSYLLGALVVYLVMLCLGELAVHMPETGAFHSYATKYIGPGTGYTVAWLYWLTWTVALGSEFTAAGLLMQRWFPDVPVWLFSGLFVIIILVINVLTVRVFAEVEFWFSAVKVMTIIAFIVLGAAAIVGFVPLASGEAAPLFGPLTEGELFPNGAFAILMTMLAVNFAYSGTELIGVAAGEAVDPKRTIPLAIRTTIVRLVVFFVGTIIVLAILLPTDAKGVLESPFVAVFERIGIPFAADIMNFVILTAILSAANSGLYAASRMLWSLSDQQMISPFFAKLSQNGVPTRAVIFSMLGGLFALLSSVYAAESVYIALVSISGLAVVVVWMSISASQYFFRRRYLREGHDVQNLVYRTPFYPVVPIVSFLICLLSLIGIAFDPTQRVALYFGIPFIGLCYLVHHLTKKSQKRSVEDVKTEKSS